MDKTTPRRWSVQFAKQKSSEYYTYYKQRSVDDDYLGRVRNKSYREEPTLRKSQSLKIRRTHRYVNKLLQFSHLNQCRNNDSQNFFLHFD